MKKLMIAALLATSTTAMAADTRFEVSIKDHMFSPAVITIPANQRVKLVVSNEDATPEEFEGEDFTLEKVIPGNSKATIMVGPFEPGRYEFVGEFHEDTAKGVLIVE
ncbi:Cupredoxin-like domain-containing protein [Amphritea atlantica]|jgi:plastocyanin|uniref:Cupredoxin-like domain-containing protein n=1 Tax=Amphritea atlantica TaxID=355243 RepID=A0A1H9IPF1_9GAMM|nr:cupredoxin domain-containing protein [Amphritea atlantica]SEQ76470.1 Cupredoxin-like domain-containing protein [Amphritea atlantica]